MGYELTIQPCASCGAPPTPRREYEGLTYGFWMLQCGHCARPNPTHPVLARYLDKAFIVRERRFPPPMRTNVAVTR